jgi:hypothetical protein
MLLTAADRIACRKKVRYATDIEAERFITRARNKDYRDAESLRAYTCPVCHGWHLTHKSTERRPLPSSEHAALTRWRARRADLEIALATAREKHRASPDRWTIADVSAAEAALALHVESRP